MNVACKTVSPIEKHGPLDQFLFDFESLECIDFFDATLKNEAMKLINKYMPNWSYEMPEVENPNARFLIGISGGVDSAALAAVLLAKHPEIYDRVTLLFCDSGVEPESCYTVLGRLEGIFGVNVVKLRDRLLLDLIDEHGGFLPSPKSRWCTKAIKIEPWNKYLKEHLLVDEETIVIGFSGLRYDERGRAGVFGIDRVESHFPFIDQKIERHAVCSFASEMGLMNRAYANGRSRSGCAICFYQSKQELIALYQTDRRMFEIGMTREKVAERIIMRLTQDASAAVSNQAAYYYSYPVSDLAKRGKGAYSVKTLFGDEERVDPKGKVTWDNRDTISTSNKKRKAKEGQFELLSDNAVDVSETDEATESVAEEGTPSDVSEQETALYVAIENYINPNLWVIGSGMMWSQKIVTYSSTLGGLSRALSGYYYHRTMAARATFASELDYDNQSHITVLCMKFPAGVIPKIKYGDDSYTWSSGRSYAEIAHTMRAIERVMVLDGIKAKVKRRTTGGDVDYEKRTLRAWRQEGAPNLGTIIGIGHYQPKDLEEAQWDSYDEDLSTVRCAICSI
jgi:3'-phosphoadenosine 5'-phosphosulfate sulfotransferase (PAPS reductase)/FAD synthetase